MYNARPATIKLGDEIRTYFVAQQPLVRSQWPRGLRRGSTPRAYWDCGLESRLGHGCLCLVSDVCCQVEVFATSWSIVQRSPTECGVSKV